MNLNINITHTQRCVLYDFLEKIAHMQCCFVSKCPIPAYFLFIRYSNQLEGGFFYNLRGSLKNC